jgi:hypothetical protein
MIGMLGKEIEACLLEMKYSATSLAPHGSI